MHTHTHTHACTRMHANVHCTSTASENSENVVWNSSHARGGKLLFPKLIRTYSVVCPRTQMRFPKSATSKLLQAYTAHSQAEVELLSCYKCTKNICYTVHLKALFQSISDYIRGKEVFPVLQTHTHTSYTCRQDTHTPLPSTLSSKGGLSLHAKNLISVGGGSNAHPAHKTCKRGELICTHNPTTVCRMPDRSGIHFDAISRRDYHITHCSSR